MDRVTPVLLVIVVALVGCAGTPIDGTVTPTTEPTATPPPVEEAPFPDGATADGINGTQVVDGHRTALRDAGSHALTLNISSSPRGRSITVGISARLDLAGNAAIGRSSQRSQGREQVVRFYASNGTGLTRQTTRNSTRYDRLPGNSSAESLSDQLTGDTIRDVLQRFEFAATDTERRNGDVLIGYESTAVSGSGTGQGAIPPGPLASNSSATLLIDGAGVVRAVSVRAVGESGGRINISITHSELGSATVERPGWADSAAAETTPVATAPEVSIDSSQNNATVETSAGSITAPVVTFQHEAGDVLNRSTLQVRVVTGDRPVPGYDVTALSVPNGRLDSVSPLAGSEPIRAGDSVRIVHVVPTMHHDSVRIDPEAGTLTAGDGSISDGRLSTGDQIVLLWTGGQGAAVLATHEVE